MINLKRGDFRVAIRATLVDGDGAPANLTDATVRFLMADQAGRVLVDRAAAITDAAAGKVVWVPEPGDTTALGLHRAEFEATYLDGRLQTYPNNEYILVEILADLG